MTTPQTDIPIPLSLSPDAQVRADIGERMSQLMQHPGWADLLDAVKAYQGEMGEQLMTFAASQEGAKYADLVGQMKGVGAVREIALGLITEGEKAAELVRLDEEEF